MTAVLQFGNRGLRGESFADIARRRGSYGATAAYTDDQVLTALAGAFGTNAGFAGFYDTKAAANAALSGLAANAFIQVFADESLSGGRSIYQKVSGAYVFKIDISSLRPDGSNIGSNARAFRGMVGARPAVNVVTDFAADPTGAVDCAAAIRSAIATGFDVYFPKGTYRVDSSLGITGLNQRLYGEGKHTTKIKRRFSGSYVLELNDSAAIDDLWFDGDGATYTGILVKLTGTNGNQTVRNAKFINSESHAVHMVGVTSGSRAYWENVEAWRTGGTTGSGLCGVFWDDAVNVGAATQTWVNFQSGGMESFSFGGAVDIMLLGGAFNAPIYSVNCKACHIIGCRVMNSSTMTVRGSGHTISGGNCQPFVTLASGATACVLGPACWNLGTADSSGNGGNLIYDPAAYSYTPYIKFGGTAWTIGNGTMAAKFIRSGAFVDVTVTATFGSTTTIPAGALTIELPFIASSGGGVGVQVGGGGFIQASSGTYYTVVPRAAAGDKFINLIANAATAYATNTAPGTIASGAGLSISFRYSI